MADIRLRITDELAEQLTTLADEQGVSRNELMVNVLAQHVDGNPPGIVLAWLKADRWGEIDDRDDAGDAFATCECGQDIDITAAWFAVMSGGKLAGPFCAGCATSE